MRSTIALTSCVLSLLVVNLVIAQKERLLAHGRVVYLELAPVDPRSLMQGDYMALRFKVANDAEPSLSRVDRNQQILQTAGNLATADGNIVVTVDGRSVGRFVRLDDGRSLGADEVRLRYRVREGQLRFATNGFFFREGTARLYESARYGEFRVSEDGDLMLKSLRGPNLEPLGPPGLP
jgi:uncharacterized membrane-anchored protein